MLKSPSLTHTFFSRYLIGVVLSILIVGSLWFYASQKQLEREVSTLHERIIQDQKEQLKERVDYVVDMIINARAGIDERIRNDIRLRTLEAYSIANSVYQQFHTIRSKQQIAEMIRTTLRPIRYNNGRGYFFATDMHGIEQLFSVKPELEGTNMLDVKDTNGKPVIKDMIELAKTNQEGFYEYTWSKPGSESDQHQKLAFIKYFAPLDWFIGTGEYLDDVISDVQLELIERTDAVRFPDGGYVFIGNDQGIVHTYPAKGRNMFKVADANGLKIVQQLIKLAESGGGYLRYVMPPLAGERPAAKISYVSGIAEWQWFIGSGDFVADLDEKLTARIAQSQQQNQHRLAAILLVLAFLLFLGFLLSWKLGQQIESGFQTFQNFFDRSANQAEPIAAEQLNFTEFKALAVSANLMLEQRQQLEQEATEYRNQLSAVINSMPSMLITINKDGLIKQWNQATEATVERSSQEAAGQPIEKFFPYLSHYRQQILHSAHPENSHFHATLRSEQAGGATTKEVTAYPLGGTTETGIVIRIDDITKRVQLEEMIVQSEKMLSVGGLAAGMAHEINNPLAGIMQNIQLARMRISTDNPNNRKTASELGIDIELIEKYLQLRGLPKMLETAMETSQRAAKIVENMLTFSRGNQAGRTSVDLPQLLDKTIELIANDYSLQKDYDFKRITIERDYAAQMPQLICEPSKIQQVLFNLLKNGAQAMLEAKTPTEKRKLTLRLRQTTESAIIIVEDTGPGIAEADRKRIFEPFFTTKKVGMGTGLGLSVSYFIITENHGGSMIAKSPANGGAHFIIEIPLELRNNPAAT